MDPFPDLVTKLFLGSLAVIQGLFGVLYKSLREEMTVMQAKIHAIPEIYVSKADNNRAFDKLDQRISDSHKETMEALRQMDEKIDRRFVGNGHK